MPSKTEIYCTFMFQQITHIHKKLAVTKTRTFSYDTHKYDTQAPTQNALVSQ